MTPNPRTLIDEQRRCLLGFPTSAGPVLVPMAYWSDGEHLWMSTARSSMKARHLLTHPESVVYVPGGGEGPGAVARGRVRIFRAGDPVGLLFHGAAIAGAMAALAVSNASSMLYAQDVTSEPASWAPPNRVVLRLRLDDVDAVAIPPSGPGVAPPLPSVVPSDVRRAVAGRRSVTLAADDGPAGVRIVPGEWGAGFSLTLPPGTSLAAGTRAAAVVEADSEARPASALGLALRGTIDERGALVPELATWWHGFRLEAAEVPPAARSGATSGIVLPD